MRQIVVGVFTQRVSAEATLRHLEMRGFHAECIGGPAMEPPVRAGAVPLASATSGARHRFKARLSGLAETARSLSLSPWSHTPRHGEVFVKVHAGSALEAQAARDILDASGARQSDGLGAKWTNWNW